MADTPAKNDSQNPPTPHATPLPEHCPWRTQGTLHHIHEGQPTGKKKWNPQPIIATIGTLALITALAIIFIPQVFTPKLKAQDFLAHLVREGIFPPPIDQYVKRHSNYTIKSMIRQGNTATVKITAILPIPPVALDENDKSNPATIKSLYETDKTPEYTTVNATLNLDRKGVWPGWVVTSFTMPIDAYKISRMPQQQKDTLTKVPFDDVAFLELFTRMRRFMLGMGAITNIPPIMVIIAGAYFITPRKTSYPLILTSLAAIIMGLILTIMMPYLFFSP